MPAIKSNRMQHIVAIVLCTTFFGASHEIQAFSTPHDQPHHSQKETNTQSQQCAIAPTPERTLSTNSYYARNDRTQSEIDPTSKEKYGASMRNVWRLVKQTSNYAALYALDPFKNKSSATCALNGLKLWAQDDALTNLTTDNANFNMGHNLSGIVLSYLTIQAEASKGDREVIDAWLKRLAHQIQAAVASHPLSKMTLNNLQYWNGLAVAAVGKATSDDALFNWGMRAYRTGVCQVSNDGSLPLEIKRGKKALDYHLYSIAPLTVLAAMGHDRGVDTFAMCNKGLSRLAIFTLKSALDPSNIEKLANATQESEAYSEFTGPKFAWLPVYLKYQKLPDLGEKMDIESMKDPFLGPARTNNKQPYK